MGEPEETVRLCMDTEWSNILGLFPLSNTVVFCLMISGLLEFLGGKNTNHIVGLIQQGVCLPSETQYWPWSWSFNKCL